MTCGQETSWNACHKILSSIPASNLHTCKTSVRQTRSKRKTSGDSIILQPVSHDGAAPDRQRGSQWQHECQRWIVAAQTCDGDLHIPAWLVCDFWHMFACFVRVLQTPWLPWTLTVFPGAVICWSLSSWCFSATWSHRRDICSKLILNGSLIQSPVQPEEVWLWGPAPAVRLVGCWQWYT